MVYWVASRGLSRRPCSWRRHLQMQPCTDLPDMTGTAQRDPRQQQSRPRRSCMVCLAVSRHQTTQPCSLCIRQPMLAHTGQPSKRCKHRHGLLAQRSQTHKRRMVLTHRCRHRHSRMHTQHMRQCHQPSTHQQHKPYTPSYRRSRRLGSPLRMSECKRSCPYTASTNRDRRRTGHSHCTGYTRQSRTVRMSALDSSYTLSCCRCPRQPDRPGTPCTC